MPKDILAISNHGTMLGGGEYSFLDLLSHLQGEWNFLGVVPKEGDLACRLRLRGIETGVVFLPPLRPWFIAHILASLKTYLSICRKHRPILIYANGSRAAFYGGVIGCLTKTPTIWHCRVAESDPYLDFFLARLSDKIIVNSKFAANRFPQRFHRKVEVTYNGVDINRLREHGLSKPKLLQEGWKIILMVARASRSKRHDLAIAAFEELAQSDSEAHLFFLGSRDPMDPQWWDYLQGKTSKSTFSKRIHWVGDVEDVRPWYQAATLSILPADMESFGRVLIEAMACGVPVVASRCGGIPEIVRHGEDGILVAPRRVDEFAEAMIRIIEDRTTRERFGQNAQKRADDFSLDRHINEMIEVFEDTITDSINQRAIYPRTLRR